MSSNWRTDPALEVPDHHGFGSNWLVIDDGTEESRNDPAHALDGPGLVADVHTSLNDAWLIAAAPSLLAACEAAAELIDLDVNEGSDRREVQAMLHTALKSAKGETP